jgi:protein O-GlcNAc transferase
MSSGGQDPGRCLSKGDYRGALTLYLRQMRQQRSPTGYANVAACLYKIGRFDYAKRYANYALQVSNYSCNPANLVLANLLSDVGEDEDASKIYLKLIKTDLRIYALQGLAVICHRRGYRNRAIRILIRAAKTHPNEVSIHLALGKFHAEAKEHHLAWTYFRQCLLIDSNCLDAWRGAYDSACALKEIHTALSIAEKLIDLDPENPVPYELKGRVLFELNLAEDCGNSYEKALERSPDNVVYKLNASNPCARVPFLGSEVYKLVRALKRSCLLINASSSIRQSWHTYASRGLIPFSYYCAYSPYNLRLVYGPYLALLEHLYRDELTLAKAKLYERSGSNALKHGNELVRVDDRGKNKVRIGLLSKFFSAHSNTQAFEGLIHYLNRHQFEVILIHKHATVVDNIQLGLNGLADEVVYLWESLEYTQELLADLSLDILFFTDLGMDPYDFMIPALRSCPIQMTGWGLPHTSGMTSIDYYLSSDLLESSEHQGEYTEKLVLLEGLPCCFMSKNLSYRKKDRDYFMMPSDRVLIGCTQNFWKIHPDFDLILEKVAFRLPEAAFVFVETSLEGPNQSFLERLAARAPQAYSQSLFLARANAADFLPLCDCLDVILDTPYYGAGVTAYMSMYVGTPTVCFAGKRLRDSTTSAIYRYLSVPNAPIASSIKDYIDNVVKLAEDFSLRLQIKKDTVASAHRLYDNQEFIRSFERFCLGLVRTA